MNITAGHEGEGAAVLIRALEPLQGIETMQTLRGGIEKNIANGPGKLTQALAIDKSFYGHDLTKAPLQIYKNFLIDKNDVITTTRVGISKAQDAPLRFYLKNSPYISRG